MSESRSISCVYAGRSLRQQVCDAFCRLGANQTSPVDEKILVRNERYVGRKFACGPFTALWIASSGELTYFGPDGVPLELPDEKPRESAQLRAAA